MKPALKPDDRMAWNVEGLGPEAEAAARRAAQRSGMSLGDWLNHLIEDVSNDDRPGSADDQISRRMAELEGELAQLSAAKSQTAAGRVYSAQRPSDRLRDAARDYGGVQPSEHISGRDAAAISAIEDALDQVVGQIEQGDHDTTRALEGIRDRLGEIGRHAARGPASGRSPANAEALERIKQRVNGLAQRAEGAGEEPAAAQDAPQTRPMPEPSEMPSHLFSPHSKGPESDEDFERLAGRLQDIRVRAEQMREKEAVAQRPRGCAPSPPEVGGTRGDWRDPPPPSGPAEEPAVRRDLSDLRSRLDTLASRDMNDLRGQIDTLARRFEENSQRHGADAALSALELRVDDLSSKINTLDPMSSPDGPMADFERRLGDLTRGLEQAVSQDNIRPLIADLEARIADLAQRAEHDQSGGIDDEAVRGIEQQVAVLASRLQAAEDRLGSIQTIEQSITGLFDTMEASKESSINAARQAAAQIVSELGQNQSGAAISEDTASALQEGLRAVQASATAAEQRNQETLEAVHETLQKVIVRLSALEDSDAQARNAPRNGAIEPPQPFAGLRAVAGAGVKPAEMTETPASARADISDLKLPPLETVAREPRTEPTLDAPAGEAGEAAPAGRNHDFIAAARRAAQAAQITPDATLRAPAGEAGEKKRFSLFKRGKRKKAEMPVPDAGHVPAKGKGRRRPLLLAAAVLLMIGAVTTYASLTGKKDKPETPAAIEDNSTAGAPASPVNAPDAEKQPANEAAPASAGEDDTANNAAPAAAPPAEPAAGQLPEPDKTSALDAQPMLPARTELAPSEPAPEAELPKAVAPEAAAPQPADPPAAAAPAPKETSAIDAPAGTEHATALSNDMPPGMPGSANYNMFGTDPRQTLGADPVVTGSLPPPAAPPKAAAPAAAAQPTAANASGLELPPSAIGSAKLRQAAAGGDPKAQFEVATRFLKGDGISVDYRNAATWYQRAAAKGLAPAQYRLGTLYEKGRGVPQDKPAARIWYERAAEKGNRKAMHNLAVIYADGSAGKRDLAKAAAWFRRAAEHGLTDSQYNLAILNERGLGVPKNAGEAYKWFAIAAGQGDKSAAEKHKQLETELTPEALVQAKLAVQSWRPKPVNGKANAVHPPAGGWGESTPQTAASDDRRTIAEVQSRLNKLGLAAGPADGIMGERTRQAIRAFETQLGRQPTGTVTPTLVSKLRARTS